MSARGFRSVFMVASCAGAALGCYLVSLRVASERAALEDVETKIVLAQRDIRVLQTEIGTRGRLAQLERWNVKVLALSAPSADQFLNGGFELARLVQPKRTIDIEAPVVLAAAPGNAPRPRVEGAPAPAADEQDLSPKALLHTVSLKREDPRTVAVAPRPVATTAGKAEAKQPAPLKARPEPAKPAATAAVPRTMTPVTARPKVAAPVTNAAAAKPKPTAPAAKSQTATPKKPLGGGALTPVAAKPKKIASSSSKGSTKTP